MKSNPIFTITLAAAAIAVFSGCGNGADKPAGADEAAGQQIEELSPLDELFAKADELFSSGATNETVALLRGALADEKFAESKGSIYSSLSNLLLYTGDAEGAKELAQEVLTGEPELSGFIVGPVFHGLMQFSGAKEALDWSDSVLKLEALPADVRRNLVEWNIWAAINAGEDERAVSAVLGLIAGGTATDSVDMTRRIMENMISSGKLDILEAILGKAGKSVTSDAGVANLLSMMKLRLAAARGSWDGFAEQFGAASAAFSDRDMFYVMRTTLPAAIRAKRFPVVDAVCEKIVRGDTAAKPLSYEYAARQWLASAAEADVAEVPVRLAVLVENGRQPGEVGSIFLRHAYGNIDDLKFVSSMKQLGERLSQAAGDESSRASIDTILMDYAFLLEDYDYAISILERKIPGYDDSWHAMALAKVKAHKALAENRPLDAIKEFRSFMAAVQASEDGDTSDPSTGVIHTKEMILGRNAARIGDIYTSVTNKESAAAAYAEARDYFAKAIEKTTDPETAEIAKKELADLSGK